MFDCSAQSGQKGVLRRRCGANVAQDVCDVLLDACVVRYGVKKEVRDFAEKTQFPIYAAPMGKTAIDENYERYGGVSVLTSLT